MNLFQTDDRPPRFRWRIPVLAIASASVVLLVVVAIEDSRGNRALGFLAYPMELLMAGGKWLELLLWTHPIFAGLVVVGICALLALLHFVRGRKAAVPLILLLVALGVAAAAQGLIKGDRLLPGFCMYVLSFVLAMVGGFWPEKGAPLNEPAAPNGGKGEWIGVTALSVVSIIALVSRLYAVNQIPAVFDDEMVGTMIRATSITGIRTFMVGGTFLGNSFGAYHVVVMYVLHKVFGSSLLMVRLAAAVAGVLAVPFFYAFLRMVKGNTAALFGSAILGFSALQLFISRSDFNFFIYVPLLGILMAWLAIRAVETCRWRYYFLLLLAMPASRFVYTPGNLAWLIPIGLFVHQAVFRRGFLRRAWPGIFFLAAGTALWVYSLTLVLGAIKGDFEWIHPIQTYGAAAWDRTGADASFVEQAKEIGDLVGKNLMIVADGVFHQTRNPTHFFQSWKPPNHRGAYVISPVAALLVPALGLLLSRVRDVRAFLIFVWIVAALIPGCFSAEASERRAAMLFPAIYAAGAIYVAAILDQSRKVGDRRLTGVAFGLLFLGLVGTVLAGLNSAFQVPAKTPNRVVQARFFNEVMDDSELVIHDCPYRIGMGIELFNLDRLMDEDAKDFIQYDPESDWPLVAFHPGFRADSSVYWITGTGEQARARYTRIEPTSYVFVLRERQENKAKFELLEQLYPDAAVTKLEDIDPHDRLRAFRISADAPRVLTGLEARWNDSENADEVLDAILKGVPYRLTRGASEEQATVQGGLLVKDFGWYAFDWHGDAESPTVAVSERVVQKKSFTPLTAGVHSFSITIADPEEERRSLDLRWGRFPDARYGPVSPDIFMRPRVLSVAAARAQRLVLYGGHPSKTGLAESVTETRDVAYVEAGALAVLRMQSGRWMVQRFDLSGKMVSEWYVDVGYQPDGLTMAVAPDGTVTLIGTREFFSFSSDGRPLGKWGSEIQGTSYDGIYDDRGNLWVCYSRRHGIVCYGPDREFLYQYGSYGEGAGQFIMPNGVALTADRKLYVADSRGRVQILRLGAKPEDIVWEGEFMVHPESLPFEGRHFGVDSKGWFFYPEKETRRILVYDPEGNRRAAQDPQRDLNGMGIDVPWNVEAGGGYLFVYDRSRHTIWKVPQAF